MGGTESGLCEPLDATAESALASCAIVVRTPANARGRSLRDDRTRFPGKHLGATAIRVSAGSFWSLTSARSNSLREAVGCSDPIDRIRSARIVRLFGVSRFRPPRRSPGLEPLNMFLFSRLGLGRGGEPWRSHLVTVLCPAPDMYLTRSTTRLGLSGPTPCRAQCEALVPDGKMSSSEFYTCPINC